MGKNPEIGELLDPFRAYLRVLAQVHLDGRLRGKVDASDIVQQTMLRACAGFDDLRGREPVVVAAWLRKILARTLADAVRHLERAKRDLGRERSLEDAINQSASGLEVWLAADQSSPSQKAERNEQLLRLADALCTLPDDTRAAVVLKHCRDWTLVQIAEHLGRPCRGGVTLAPRPQAASRAAARRRMSHVSNLAAFTGRRIPRQCRCRIPASRRTR